MATVKTGTNLSDGGRVLPRVRLFGFRRLAGFRRRILVQFGQEPVRGRFQISVRNSLQPSRYRRDIVVVVVVIVATIVVATVFVTRFAAVTVRDRRTGLEMREAGVLDLVQQRIPFFFGRLVAAALHDNRSVPDVVTVYLPAAFVSIQP